MVYAHTHYYCTFLVYIHCILVRNLIRIRDATALTGRVMSLHANIYTINKLKETFKPTTTHNTEFMDLIIVMGHIFSVLFDKYALAI